MPRFYCDIYHYLALSNKPTLKLQALNLHPPLDSQFSLTADGVAIRCTQGQEIDMNSFPVPGLKAMIILNL